MTINPDDVLEARVPTPAELAEFIKTRRKMNRWSQMTLAEIARVTDRTIQRVENGEPSSLDVELTGQIFYIESKVPAVAIGAARNGEVAVRGFGERSGPGSAQLYRRIR